MNQRYAAQAEAAIKCGVEAAGEKSKIKSPVSPRAYRR